MTAEQIVNMLLAVLPDDPSSPALDKTETEVSVLL